MTPSAPDDLYSVLESFKPALKSIDIRSIVVSQPSERYWLNLITSIILSDKTIEEVQTEQKTLPTLRNNYFALFCDALPFDYLPLTQISEGKFTIPWRKVGGNRIQFRKSDVFDLKVNSSQEWMDDSYRWILRAASSGTEEERKELWNIANGQCILATQLEFDSIPKMIQDFLKIGYSAREKKDIEIIIYPPASIENLHFNKNNLEIILEKKTKLNNLQLNLNAQSGNRIYWRKIHKINSEKTDFKNNPEIIDVKKITPLDYLNVKLIHRDSGLTLDRTFKQVPLTKVAEPFLKTVDAFCSLDELKTMLFEPKKYGNNPSKIFEIAISWLLSLAGFSVIYLGTDIKIPKSKESKKTKVRKFDVLFNPQGNQVGSADIIAYDNYRQILLIDCDIGSVNDSKVQQLVGAKNYFNELLRDFGGLHITPILFTLQDFRKTSPSVDVAIIDQPIIKRIFEAVIQGNQEQARSSLNYSGI